MAERQKGRKVEGARGRRVKGVREIGVIERASATEIQRKLLEVMVGVLDGRMETEEALAIGMVAEEQIRRLEEESKGAKVEESKGPKVEEAKGQGGGEAKGRNGEESSGEKSRERNGETTKGKDRYGRWVN